MQPTLCTRGTSWAGPTECLRSEQVLGAAQCNCNTHGADVPKGSAMPSPSAAASSSASVLPAKAPQPPKQCAAILSLAEQRRREEDFVRVISKKPIGAGGCCVAGQFPRLPASFVCAVARAHRALWHRVSRRSSTQWATRRGKAHQEGGVHRPNCAASRGGHFEGEGAPLPLEGAACRAERRAVILFPGG